MNGIRKTNVEDEKMDAAPYLIRDPSIIRHKITTLSFLDFLIGQHNLTLESLWMRLNSNGGAFVR